MTTLYELNGYAAEIYDALQGTEDPDLRNALIDKLADIEIARDEKIKNYCIVIKSLRANAAMYADEAKRLEAEKDKLNDSADRALSRLRGLVAEGEEWANGVHSFKWTHSKAVKVVDEKSIPTAYMREILKYEPDKKQIAADLKCGATIPGVELEERCNLTIK